MTGGRRFALLVAAATYADPKLAQLRAPAHDIEALREVLEDPAIGSFEVRTLLDEQHWAVMSEMEGFFVDRSPDDLCLLYLSCHGIKDANGRLHFAAPNTSFSRLAATGISSAWVNEQLERSLARRAVILLDCCYSGAFAKGFAHRSGTAVDVTGDLGGRGRVVITASDAMEYAWEGDDLTLDSAQPSVFTSAIVTGLRTGEADRDGDGVVTASDLYAHVHEAVRRTTPHQTPTVSILGAKGDLVVARNPAPPAAPATAEPLPPEVEAALFDQRSFVRKAAVDRLSALAAGPSAGLALTAARALERMADDPEQEVRAAARSGLEAGGLRPPRPPPEPHVHQAPAPIPQTPEDAPQAVGHAHQPAAPDLTPPPAPPPRSPSGPSDPAAPAPPPGWAIRGRVALQEHPLPAVAVAVALVLTLGILPRFAFGGADEVPGGDPEADLGDDAGEPGEDEPADHELALTCADLPVAFVRDGHIWVQRRGEAEARNVTVDLPVPDDDPPPEYGHPAWSPDPDRRLLAFTRRLGTGPRTVHLLDLGSGALRPLTAEEGQRNDVDPAWFPSGDRIVFSREIDDRSQLHVVDVPDEGGGMPAARLLHASDGHAQRPAASAGGLARVVFHRQAEGSIALEVVDAGGADRRVLLDEEGASAFHPSWSPDGSEVVFALRDDGDHENRTAELHRIGGDGHGLRPLVDGRSLPGWDPNWCPAGGEVLYEARDDAGVPQIFRIDLGAGGADPAQVTRHGGRDPAW